MRAEKSGASRGAADAVHIEVNLLREKSAFSDSFRFTSRERFAIITSHSARKIRARSSVG